MSGQLITTFWNIQFLYVYILIHIWVYLYIYINLYIYIYIYNTIYKIYVKFYINIYIMYIKIIFIYLFIFGKLLWLDLNSFFHSFGPFDHYINQSKTIFLALVWPSTVNAYLNPVFKILQVCFDIFRIFLVALFFNEFHCSFSKFGEIWKK